VRIRFRQVGLVRCAGGSAGFPAQHRGVPAALR
jgi:hypothetical protein